MSLAVECMPKMDCFSIDEAPKDGTRILAWPCIVDSVRAGCGAHVEYCPVYGWGVVTWSKGMVSSDRDGWICSPNEATEYEYDVQPVKWWMELPATPYGEK